MNKLTIILLFVYAAGFSQSVKIDGPTGQVSDLAEIVDPAATDLIIMERNDSSKKITYINFTNPPHGAFAFHDSAVTLDMDQNAWEMVTNPTTNLFISQDESNIDFDGDSVTIVLDGDYIINISLSFSGTANDFFEISFFKNGALFDISMERSTSQTDVGNVSLPLYLEDLVAGDDISFKIRNTNSDDDATIVACSWIIWRLHL